MEEQKSNQNSIIGALAAFLVIALGALGYFIYNSQSQAKVAEKMRITMDSLYQVREGLLIEVDRLNNAYDALSNENSNLKGELESIQSTLATRERQLANARRKAATVESLQQDITSLKSNRDSLTSRITALEAENETLRQANEQLQEQVASLGVEKGELTNQVSELDKVNKAMQMRMEGLINSAFKASAMEVGLVRSNDKTTLKGKRARRIKVGFDLVDVPQEYQGTQNVYLSITDSNGLAVGEAKSKVKVGSGGQSTVVDVLETKKVNLGPSQRLEFNYDLTKKLGSGFYIVSVYSDKGLLGSSILQLT